MSSPSMMPNNAFESDVCCFAAHAPQRERYIFGERFMSSVTRFLVLAFFLSSALAAENVELRTIETQNIGTVTVLVPSNWKPWVGHHANQNFATTFYKLTSEEEKFFFEIAINDLTHMQLSGLTNNDLEQYIQTTMAPRASQSTEGKITTQRFGTLTDGVYARLTDKKPKTDEPIYLTNGIRLIGNNVILFTIYSNDHDSAVLQKVLSIVSSAEIKPKI